MKRNILKIWLYDFERIMTYIKMQGSESELLN